MLEKNPELTVQNDPRNYQLMVLVSMLAYGLFWLKFDLNKAWIAGIILTALLTQFLATRALKLPCFEWKSAAISGLSLSILMRCHSWSFALTMACVAILSKFLLRWKGKHIFNPTDFALAVGILANGAVWIAPGQWGNGAVLAFFIACMGSFVVSKASRSDVSLAFLGTYVIGLFSHAAWVGESMGVPLQRLQSGSLLIFAFYMISDPKTTPDSRAARLLFGTIVALTGIFLQIALKIPGGLILSLAFFSMLVPVFDQLLPGKRYRWPTSATLRSSFSCNESDRFA